MNVTFPVHRQYINSYWKPKADNRFEILMKLLSWNPNCNEHAKNYIWEYGKSLWGRIVAWYSMSGMLLKQTSCLGKTARLSFCPLFALPVSPLITRYRVILHLPITPPSKWRKGILPSLISSKFEVKIQFLAPNICWNDSKPENVTTIPPPNCAIVYHKLRNLVLCRLHYP